MKFASRAAAVFLTTMLVGIVPSLADDAVLSADCRYQDTEIIVGFEADLAAKKISLSGLKGCDLTGNTDAAMTGACADPRFRDVNFVIEYDKATDIGRWWIEVDGKPVADADGKVVDFAYFCGGEAQ